jgi:DNA-binding MarR family transcriptional regulator
LPVYDERESIWPERIRACLSVLLEQLDSEPDLARMCVVEIPRAGVETAQRRRAVLTAMTKAVDQGRSESTHGDTLSPLTAQGVVGGALSVVHTSLLDGGGPLTTLVNPLMGMIVHPYLGPAAARAEMGRLTEADAAAGGPPVSDPFKGLSIRFTYRTALVLARIAADPGASNRRVAEASGIADGGQMSRLLTRLQRAGLIENRGEGQQKGESNAWALTDRGRAIQEAIGERS